MKERYYSLDVFRGATVALMILVNNPGSWANTFSPLAHAKVIKRTVLIFLIGLFLNWSPFVKWSDAGLVFKPWENVRILGVLQRIALCYFFASVIIYYGKSRMALFIGMMILVIYW
ncbi:MAG: DUF5009 domain-containing protein, partial [Chitinophagia bacterium]|nr:DUF5009 domain-containing protein [Chitinophagia bacterium]